MNAERELIVMTPKFPMLIAVAGPLKGRTFPLGENELSIGRESANLIAIHDGSLSRRHCLIQRRGEHYELCDLDSLNGTFVNEVPARERRLSHGDCIRLGTSHFLFLQRENEPGEDFPEVYFDERTPVAGTTVELRAEDIFRELARDLHALMKIARTINSLRGAEDVRQQLLELIFEIVPAERGAVLMAENFSEGETEGGENPSFFVRRREESSPPRPFRVSRTIVRRVLRDGVSLLSN
ncbi:MAG TPA: FHA domain-containing protein, partial [Pyrinomonadaceae bacterium]|nr:FHA domain-containing protein [Pyrinomonadaceae bacterium]